MTRTNCVLAVGIALMLLLSECHSAEPLEPFLKKLAPGVFLKSSVAAPPDQTEAIGKKLGGKLTRITNSVVQVHGRPIQVNGITAADEASAAAVHAALLKIKPYPFCFRNGLQVIEYVIQQPDEALAIKTTYELGLKEKPKRLRYRVIAELATVDEADYMACNPMFNLFLTQAQKPSDATVRQIEEMSKKFKFGQTLVLRNPQLGVDSGSHLFQPESTKQTATTTNVAYTFGPLPTRQGVPYATATLEISTDASALSASAPPAAELTAATRFWPVDAPQIKALAAKITAGKTTPDAKVRAILEWLTPGKNIKYAGQTGSRWGTSKVLEQKSGHCWDFSDVFVTLARAAGVPSRQVAGWLYGSSGHVWAEYYREGHGWQQVDPTGGTILPSGIYHIAYFTTDDGAMPIVYVAMPKIEILSE